MNQPKYLTFGSIVEVNTNSGTFQKIQIDNEKLDELLNLLDGHFQKKVSGLSVDEIRQAQKLKWDDPNRLPRIEVSIFDPNEKAPDFIKGNLAIKIADYI